MPCQNAPRFTNLTNRLTRFFRPRVKRRETFSFHALFLFSRTGGFVIGHANLSDLVAQEPARRSLPVVIAQQQRRRLMSIHDLLGMRLSRTTWRTLSHPNDASIVEFVDNGPSGSLLFEILLIYRQ